VVSGVGVKDPVVQTVHSVGAPGIRVKTGKLDPQQVDDVRTALSKKIGVPPDEITDQVVGASWGQTICRKIAQRPAPSIWPASISSWGTLVSAAR